MNQLDIYMQDIRNIDGAMIDVGFGQPIDLIRDQYEIIYSEKISNMYIEGKIENYEEEMQLLVDWVKPYNIPKDYIKFIDSYGGVIISRQSYHFMVDGIGPMIHEWYGFPKSEESVVEPSRDGLFQIARLEYEADEGDLLQVFFLIDIAGRFQNGAVVGLGPLGEEANINQIIENISSNVVLWKTLANSFSEWIALLAKTKGTFNYIDVVE